MGHGTWDIGHRVGGGYNVFLEGYDVFSDGYNVFSEGQDMLVEGYGYTRF